MPSVKRPFAAYRFARPVNTSWRVDETYIKVRGKWNFLYRAVDEHGKTVDFLLRPDRSIAASARLVLCQGVNLKCADPGLNRSGTPIARACNAPLP
jgi:hypothetical protein